MKQTGIRLMRRFRRPSGQSLVEYSLILAFIAIVCIVILRGMGGTVRNTIESVNTNIP